MTKRILDEDSSQTDVMTLVSLLWNLLGAEDNYAAAMSVKNMSSIYICHLLHHYSSTVRTYTYGNLQSEADTDVECDQFLTAVAELHLYSSWVLEEYEINSPVDFYTEQDFKNSSIFDRMTLKPN